MFWSKKRKINKEKKENEERLRKLNGREVRYVSKRDDITYIETVIGKNGVIDVTNDIFSVICSGKVILRQPLENVSGSELMSLDGIILTYKDADSDNNTEIMVYYKYYRKVDN